MADTWLTIEQAAVALGLSVRTVNRYIAAGKIQSRLSDGRREVLVDIPEETADVSTRSFDDIGATIDAAAASPFAANRVNLDSHRPAAMADTARQASDHVRQASDQVRRASEATAQSPAFDPNTVLALADNAAEKAELAISAYQALARATDTQFRHVRRSARVAWASVSVMAAGVAVAVGWTTHQLTRSQMQGQYFQQQVSQTSAVADTATAERERLRGELAAAPEAAARAEGQVSAMADAQARFEARQASAPSATQPTTRPRSIMDLSFLSDNNGE